MGELAEIMLAQSTGGVHTCHAQQYTQVACGNTADMCVHNARICQPSAAAMAAVPAVACKHDTSSAVSTISPCADVGHVQSGCSSVKPDPKQLPHEAVLAALHPPQPELSADAATVLDFFDALYQLRALTTPKGGDPGGLPPRR
jgi:hypothetical protein